ncbi:uncharacterized protein LOC130743209 [Lotus japonicus]|uniref:uncharacterized protein LOC130743209 n=1 Tax=Lotus japonicus TaxID=34305 RepID=UPI002589CEEC|nr:uncharacterized protein LOC130743209 [Lotus japonicus]
MERDQENMQFLGLVGVYKESYMIMISWKKIFSLITLILILPLSVIFLFMEVSPHFCGDISYYSKPHFVPRIHPRHTDETISSQLLSFILFKLEYFVVFVLMGCFSLHPTSAVVYTVTSVYTDGSDGVTFNKVMNIVPKVWKRLVITFVCTILAFFVYNVVVRLVIIFIWPIIIREKNYGTVIYVVIWVLDSLGLLYLTTIWQLANVVSMLEDSCGFKAMMKSNELIKGKKFLSIIINYMSNYSFFSIQLLFSEVVLNGWKMQVDVGFVWRIPLGVLCVLVFCFMFLLMLVIQTVLYFVCKSYHHETIGKSALSEQLEVYQGEHEQQKVGVTQDSHV